MRWAGHVAGVVNKKIKDIGGKARRKKPLGISRCGWVDIIKMGLKEIGWGSMDWFCMTLDSELWRTVVNTVMDSWFP
jgi:hypothetical protein